MQCFMWLKITLMLGFQKQSATPYLSRILIVYELCWNRMYVQSDLFSYFKRKHEDWFIKNVKPILSPLFQIENGETS